jgi:Chromatin associated protein KTI12
VSLSSAALVHGVDSCSLENLLVRFEEPSSMVRWDSPLFTLLWEEEDVPADEIWKAITAGNVKAPHAGTQVVRPTSISACPLYNKLIIISGRKGTHGCPSYVRTHNHVNSFLDNVLTSILFSRRTHNTCHIRNLQTKYHTPRTKHHTFRITAIQKTIRHSS